jgi:hypothetical protein
MLEHLSNCHGEWNMLIALIGSIPFIGAWLRVKLQSLKNKKVPDEFS